MFFLDVNALYWYIGVEKLGFTGQCGVNAGKLCKFMDAQQVRYIPSSVYLEMVTHFRQQPDKLKIILKFLEEKNFKIENIIGGGYECKNYELTFAINMNETELVKYARSLLQKKINIEASFAYTFAEIVRIIYLEYLMRLGGVENESEKSLIIATLGREQFDQGHEKEKAKFIQALTEGYERDDEARAIQDVYIQFLEEQCLWQKLFIDNWIALIKNNEKQEVNLQKSVRKILEKLARENGVMKTIHTTAFSDTQFLIEASERISEIFVKRNYSKSQAGYLRDVMFPAWFNTAQKLRKNDIFDMLCVGVLDIKAPINSRIVIEDRDTYLITFDQTMRGYIKNVKPYNDKIIDSFTSQYCS